MGFLPTTPGMIWNSELGIVSGGGLASLIANVVTASNNEIQVLGTTIAANAMAVGTTYRIRAFGQCTSTHADNVTFRIRIGSTTLTGTIVGSLVDTTTGTGTFITFSNDYLLTVRSTGASGSILVFQERINDGVTGLSAASTRMSPANVTTINTTQSNILEFTIQTAAYTTSPITFWMAEIEIVKP